MAGEDVSWAWRLWPRLPLLGLRAPLVDSGSFSFLGSPPVSQAFPGIVHLKGCIPGTHAQRANMLRVVSRKSWPST